MARREAFLFVFCCFGVAFATSCQKGNQPPGTREVSEVPAGEAVSGGEGVAKDRQGEQEEAEKDARVVTPRPRQVAVGEWHACALTTLGAVECWGGNGFGQLGDGTVEERLTPTRVPGLEAGVRSIEVGERARGSYTCVLLDTGGVKCWGENTYGQLGDGTTEHRSSPVRVRGLDEGVARLFVEENFACALMASKGVKCWGRNYAGDPGDGAASSGSSPLDIEGLDGGVRDLVLGADFACALLESGGVKCWGANESGQLGSGERNNTWVKLPVDLAGLDGGVTQLAAGHKHVCALLASKEVKCWGWNSHNQINAGNEEAITSPARIVGLGDDVSRVVAGSAYNCALMSSGKVKCWGRNETGLLGDGTEEERAGPVEVVGLGGRVREVALTSTYYEEHACALLESGKVKCWGQNAAGQLGEGTTENRASPTDVIGLEAGVESISISGRNGCALMQDDRIKCWGNESNGRLGDGLGNGGSRPSKVLGLEGVVASALVAGGSHNCVLTEKGGVKCWGGNHFGQLGDGTRDARPVPTDVPGLEAGVIQLVAGHGHNCALLASGVVKCWGWNVFGQVGDGTTTNRTKPFTVPGLKRGEVVSLELDAQLTCALLESGGVKCWGDNSYGQLGRGRIEGDRKAGYVKGLTSGVAKVSLGDFHMCALLESGGVKCWGWNNRGQGGIDDASKIELLTPTDVIGLGAGVADVVASNHFTCALMASGEVKCWGANHEGELGDGTEERRNKPVDVRGLEGGARALFVGASNNCALTKSGGLECWGFGGTGQMGDNNAEGNLVPGDVSGLTAGVRDLVIGDSHMCALLEDRSVRCWGYNGYGSIGDGNTEDVLAPIEPEGLEGEFEQVAIGDAHTCALKASGEVWCWGERRHGQLGDGTTEGGSRAVFIRE